MYSGLKYQYTWQQFDKDVADLEHVIKVRGVDYDVILGLSRGGLLPAVSLSHRLGVPMIALNYSLADPQREVKYRNEMAAFGSLVGKKVLLVEDLADSGNTLHELLTTHLADVDVETAVLLFKPHTSRVVPNYCGSTFKLNDWIVFPWEIE